MVKNKTLRTSPSSITVTVVTSWCARSFSKTLTASALTASAMGAKSVPDSANDSPPNHR